jgi:DNA-binding NarL/FixJ family response regulator
MLKRALDSSSHTNGELPARHGLGSLTEREQEVLGLVCQGALNKEIAISMKVSENTVRSHVRSLMQKLDMHNRTQLAVYGMRKGYATPPGASPWRG